MLIDTQAVMVAIYMAENAAVALSAGAPHHAVPTLPEEEAEETARRLLTPGTVARVWAGRVTGLSLEESSPPER
ncbi:hypothetical protein [Roseomonas indoligenes]|uniref:Uncharacterized protein n=1 Tax=Roseomonas indoligenes TaxID=2820811 RepID=A0A940N2Q8_9PROT|nr:hypothetical protein [Pararoseomonas indoligenes]MBP0495675.1 hypothetical protein [Pararoseomonas indoligenes]